MRGHSSGGTAGTAAAGVGTVIEHHADNEHMVARVMAARERARHDAIKNLARYKFSNFGYHAARWVTLNAIIGDKRANPFRVFVELARREALAAWPAANVGDG